jgi:hypothetical protein
MSKSVENISLASAARIAGYGYLAIIVLAIFAEFFVRSTLVVPGDAVTTANNIMANQGLYRFGVASYLLAAIFDVMVAVALYIFLRPVNKGLALLAAWFRLIHAIIFAVALTNLLNVLHLLSGAEYLSAFTAEQLQAQLMVFLDAFDYEWLIGLVFFGLHCLLLGYLIVKSDYVPKILGILLVVAAFGYLVDSFAHFLMASYSDYQDVFLMMVALPAIAAELSFCLWLLIKGARLERAQ